MSRNDWLPFSHADRDPGRLRGSKKYQKLAQANYKSWKVFQ